MARLDGRANDELRPVMIIRNVNEFAEGSVMIKCGKTHVNITASVEDRVPPHVPEGEGWITAEYNMLPRANRTRSRRYFQAETQWPQCRDSAAYRPVPSGRRGYEEAGAPADHH